MADLPKELFEIGRPNSKRKYFFINIYGKEESIDLRFGDKLLNFLRCPLDGDYIVSYRDKQNKNKNKETIEKCPACKNFFEGDPESVVRYLDKSYAFSLKEKVRGLKENTGNLGRIRSLERILELLKNPNNNVKQANLQNQSYSAR